MDLKKNCKYCAVALTIKNAAKKTKKYYRNYCKSCDSKISMEWVKSTELIRENRKAYARDYIRRVGRVKEYPCEGCNVLCYKKYARAFCSDKCRFMSHVKKQFDGCWIWTGSKGRRGYGQTNFKSNRITASRFSYELFVGPIEKNKMICHTCDVPSCVNPEHLWSGSAIENSMDMVDKGRQNSKLTPTDVFKIRTMLDNGYNQSAIKEKFNVSSSQISNIKARRIWKHV
jgi:hypothetical protein